MLRLLGLTALLWLALAACAPAPDSTSAPPVSLTPAALPTPNSHLPTPNPPTFARGSVTVHTTAGAVSLRVEIADTEAKREYGLMNRTSLAPDAGMLFVFQPPAGAQQIGFWMKDTLIPLSIAFVEPDLTIESLQEMAAESQQIHYAPKDYQFALEANPGFFTSHGVAVGDSIVIGP